MRPSFVLETMTGVDFVVLKQQLDCEILQFEFTLSKLQSVGVD